MSFRVLFCDSATKSHVVLLALVGGVLLWLAGAAVAGDAERLYVAPDERGAGTGATSSDAMGLDDTAMWDLVRQRLQSRPVTVTLLSGRYDIRPMRLDRLGGAGHPLLIEAEVAGEAIIQRDPQDERIDDPTHRPTLLEFSRSRGVTFRGLQFSGPAAVGYVLRFRHCRDIRVESCQFVDLPGVYFGAAGTIGECDGVSFIDCTFERIGSSGRAHMIYNAHGPRNLTFTGNRFVDCAGDFIRFRDQVSGCLVAGNVFRQTTSFVREMRPFISIPLFNDDDPASQPAKPQYERFGRDFRIERNRFEYEVPPGEGMQPAIIFWAKGFNPPGTDHLLTPDEAQAFRDAEPTRQRMWLMERNGLDIASLELAGNVYENVRPIVALFIEPAYGSEARSGVAPVWFDLTHLAGGGGD